MKKKLMEYLFVSLAQQPATFQELYQGLNDARIQPSTLKGAIDDMAKHGILARNATTRKYQLLESSDDLLYRILDISFDVEQTIGDDGNQYVYAYYYEAYRTLAQMNEVDQFPMKIGFTTRPYPLIRIAEQLTTSTPETPIVAILYKCRNAQRIESLLHQYFKLHNKHFRVSHNNEWFNTNPQEMIETLQRLLQKDLYNLPS